MIAKSSNQNEHLTAKTICSRAEIPSSGDSARDGYVDDRDIRLGSECLATWLFSSFGRQ